MTRPAATKSPPLQTARSAEPGLLVIRALLLVMFLVLGAIHTAPVHALGDGSTRFNIYVPANASHTSRRSILIVTNVSPLDATVDIIDDDADGDNDDTALGVSLGRGESYIVKLADGDVNDDLGGTADGDYFKVRSDHPVVVQMATHSNWQHDWVPSEGKTSRGNNFFVYAPPTSGANNDINIYAYEDDTVVTIKDVTVAPRTSTGKTEIDLDNAELVLETTLHLGEDLIVRENGLGLDILRSGRTYWVQASSGVTVQYGHLGQINGGARARDGAGFIPSANGTSAGSLYFFAIPHEIGLAREKELRLVCFDDNTTVSLYGSTSEDAEWELISQDVLDAGDHLDFVGRDDAAFRDKDLYKLTVDPPYYKCTAFEGNWMETGSFGTSDFASAVSSRSGQNVGDEFVAYIGPPGRMGGMRHPQGEQTNDASPVEYLASHLYVYADTDATEVTVYDVDTGGQLFEHVFTINRDEYYDVVIDKPTYLAMSANGYRPYLGVRSSEPIAVMNGNFNDNWMAFFNSVLEPVPEVTLDTTDTDLTCNETTTLTVSCSNPGGPSMTGLTATLALPDGLELVTGTGAPADPNVNGNFLQWTAATLDSDQTRTFAAQVRLNCDSVPCVPADLSSVTAECQATFNGQSYASLASANHTLTNNGSTVVTGFSVLDNPDYDGDPIRSRVEVAFTLQGGIPGTSKVQLVRATNNPDPDAIQQVLLTLDPSYSAEPQVYYFQDEYSLHLDQARYYRLLIDDGGCTNTEGPVSVRTSSGGSSGEDSGLESDGRLASRLARREVARSDKKRWFSARTTKELEHKTAMRTARGALEINDLEQFLPELGPGASSPSNATPTDLPALTNAEAVFAADYWSQAGQRVASALVLETFGEVYDHSKILCDRAKGARIEMLEHMETAESAFVRSALVNERNRTGDFAIEFKLYQRADGGFDMHSQWLRHHYPAPEPGQRVINVQLWSSKAGYEVSMAHLILDELDVAWMPVGKLPGRYFAEAGTLGGTIHAELGHIRGDDLHVGVTRLLEDGTVVHTTEPMPEGGVFQATYEPFIDATVDIVNADGEVQDTVWMSDGAWTALDDAMWGGESQRLDFSTTDCIQPHNTTPDALRLSGCARVQANVSDFAGVARHLGGAMAPIDVTAFGAVAFWLKADSPTTVCMESPGSEPGCAALPAMPEGQTVTLPVSAFVHTNTCEPTALTGVNLVSFMARQAGEANVEVGALAFLPSGDGDWTNHLGCQPDEVPVNAASPEPAPDSPLAERQRRFGPSCSTGTANGNGPGDTALWVLLLMVAGVVLRSKRR